MFLFLNYAAIIDCSVYPFAVFIFRIINFKDKRVIGIKENVCPIRYPLKLSQFIVIWHLVIVFVGFFLFGFYPPFRTKRDYRLKPVLRYTEIFLLHCNDRTLERPMKLCIYHYILNIHIVAVLNRYLSVQNTHLLYVYQLPGTRKH